MREPRDFTVAELVAAGQELGIDALTVCEVHQEYQRELARPPGRPRPHGSDLQLRHEDGTLILSVPPRTWGKVKAGMQTAGSIGLVTFFSYVHAPWPLLAAAGTVAIGISYLALSQARTTRQLRLHRDGSGVLANLVGGRGKGIPLQAGQVHARLDERVVDTQNGRHRVSFLALDHGIQTYELLEGFTRAEQAWAVGEIERWLGR